MTPEMEVLEAARLISAARLDEIPRWRLCPTCDSHLVPEGFEPSYEQIEKLKTWTLAQLVAFRNLQARSGIPFDELLDRTSGGVMPGIGGAINGDVGTIGVSNFHGMFVGIEPDGYTHS